MPKPKSKPVGPKPPCRHVRLHFEAGGFHVVCSDCKATWNAVRPDRFTPDYTARSQGLTDQDRRHDPFQTLPL